MATKEKPLEPDEVYGFDYKRRKCIGRAMIISNVKFNKRDDGKQVQDRSWSKKDAEVLERILSNLGFKGALEGDKMTREDVTKAELKDIMKNAAARMNNDDRDDFGCFLCILMSYGEPGVIFCKSENESQPNEPCELKELQEPFKPNNCEKLALKPKIFLVQACPYFDKATADGDEDKGPQPVTTVKIPTESDFVTHFSRQPGRNGWRDGPENLSEYVYALKQTLNGYHSKEHNDDFLRMLTRINRSMSESQKDCPGDIPLVTSTLTKRINWDFYRS